MFLLLIVGIVLLPEALSLKCHSCTPDPSGSCTSKEMDCPTSDFRCGATRTLTYMGGAKLMDLTVKMCVLPMQCTSGSMNFGSLSKTAVATKCCTTNLCNTEVPPEPAKANPNGKKCYTCGAGGQCTATLNCDGDEDHCVTMEVDAGEKMTMKGCATKSLCEQSAMAGSSSPMKCCQGNYCNSGSAVRAGLLMLAAPLVSLLFLS